MKYIALNLFLGSHPSQTAMLVSCGCPCIYIKIVWKISPLFMPWVCKHDLLSASCKWGSEVCWRLGLCLSDSSVHAMAVCWWQDSLLRATILVQSPEWMGSFLPLTSWLMPSPKRHKWNICFIRWRDVFVCLPCPHFKWLCNPCWRCVTTHSHGSVFILHRCVSGLGKKDTC